MPQGRILAMQARYKEAQRGHSFRKTTFDAKMIAEAKRAAYERILELLTAERDALDAKARAAWAAAQKAAEAEAAAEASRQAAAAEAAAAKLAAEQAEAEERVRLEKEQKEAEEAHRLAEEASRVAIKAAAEAKADAEMASEEAAEAEAKLAEAQRKFKEEMTCLDPPEATPPTLDPVSEAISAAEDAASPRPAPEPTVEPPEAEPEESVVEEHKGLTAASSAADFCAAFFAAMDFNDSGFIEESEVIQLSEVAFGESAEASMGRWHKMLSDMDKDHDGQVSKEEYTNWWLEDTKPKQQDDGTFVKGYANYLLTKLSCIQEVKQELNAATPATELCSAFFDAMDLDEDGLITQDEVLQCATVAFGETPEAADARWAKMLAEMDTNEDQQISKAEYVKWWMSETASKQNEDGSFADGYSEFLLTMLEKLQQIKSAQDGLYGHEIEDDTNLVSLFATPADPESLPGGTWKDSSRNVEAEDGLLSCELQNEAGDWVEASTEYSKGDEFANSNGTFKMTKSGNPPPMPYYDEPEHTELTEEETALLQRVSYGGWLKKRGGSWKSWKTRWFSIEDGNICYAVHRDEVPIAKISVKRCRVKAWKPSAKSHLKASDEEAKLRFVIVMPGRELVLCAFSAEDKAMWEQAIQLSAKCKTKPATDEHLIREGWMWKRAGHSAKFHKRYFRLVNSDKHGAHLYWFLDAYHVTHPKGELPLGGAQISVDTERRFLTISLPDVETVRTFRCPGLGALNDWNTDIMKLSTSQDDTFTAQDIEALTAEFEKTMLGVLGYKPDKKWMAKQEKKLVRKRIVTGTFDVKH